MIISIPHASPNKALHTARFGRYRLLLLVILFVTAVWQLGEGLYIYAKAELAQALLTWSWQQSKRTQHNIKPWQWADTWPVARMQLPEKDVDLIILAGDSGRSLAFGPGHRFGSVLPGELGNSIISGHRDTHFAFLQTLTIGDTFIIENRLGQQKVFAISEHFIAHSERALLNLFSDVATISLVTCYPFDAIEPGGPLRYVVIAKQIEAVESNGKLYSAKSHHRVRL